MSNSIFPCVRATTIDTIENFITGLQLTSYNNTHTGNSNSRNVTRTNSMGSVGYNSNVNSTCTSPFTTKMNTINTIDTNIDIESDTIGNDIILSGIDIDGSNSPTNIQ